MNDLLARLWRLGRPLQWRFLWLMHAKFICGITGVLHDGERHVLLLRHRSWPPDRQWGFPTGYANKGERHEASHRQDADSMAAHNSGCQHGPHVYWPKSLWSDLHEARLVLR